MRKIILFTIYCLLFTVVLTGCKKKKPKEPEKKPPPAVINQLPIKERPYISLLPREDGREVSLTIHSSGGADLVEYELEYQAGNMIQGAFGRIDFKNEQPPVVKKLLFGSCSKGKCKYDEDVKGGSLTLRFEGDSPFVLKGDFSLQQMADKEGVFSSKNSQVALDVGPKGLAKSDFVIVVDTLGLPKTIEGKIVVGPYGFFMANPPKTLKTATLSFQTSEDPEGLKIYGYADGDWEEYSQNRAIDGKRLSVSVDQLTTFILVK